jgi:probable DNA metabolism protein
MRIFVYDKTFDGLLSAIFEAYASRMFPDALLGEGDVLPLTATDSHTVRTDPGKAGRVFAGLKKKLSPEGLRGLLYVWLSEQPGHDLLLFRHMRKVFDSCRRVEQDFSDPDVLAVSDLANKVGHEGHQLTGFVRFQKTAEAVYFAAIAPRYNVLPLLPGHFAGRLADQDWIIYDAGRHYGIAFDRGVFRAVSMDESRLRQGRLNAADLDESEPEFQALWKTYFASTAIKERLNPRLQARCLPRRFWVYLTETQME